MYLLPNNNKIDEDGLFDAFLDHRTDREYYLDSVTGDIGCVDGSSIDAKKKHLDPTRYFKIPHTTLKKKTLWLQEFVQAIVAFEDKVFAHSLKGLIHNGYDTAVQVLEKHSDDWMSTLRQWEGDSVFPEVEAWIDSLPIEITCDWGFDCDCEMCKLIQKGDHSVGDFMEAAAKQEKKQRGVVFGTREDLLFKEKDIDELYYEAMECIDEGDCKKAEALLLEAVALDKEYVQTYIGLVHVYGNTKQKKKREQMTELAFEKTQKFFPKWPKELLWGYLGNRAYLRAIQYKAENDEEHGKRESAVELYRLLLKMNPNDNQGVRYVLAGLYAGISGDEINTMTDEGNRKQNWDALETLVWEQNKKHKFWKAPKL